MSCGRRPLLVGKIGEHVVDNAGQEEEIPMLFHVSHDKMTARYGGKDGGVNRAGTMRREWIRLKKAATAKCKRRAYDAGSYGEDNASYRARCRLLFVLHSPKKLAVWTGSHNG